MDSRVHAESAVGVLTRCSTARCTAMLGGLAVAAAAAVVLAVVLLVLG